MKLNNKIELKKYLKTTFICIFMFCILSSTVCLVEYKIYTVNYNKKIYSVLTVLKEKYPDITEEEMIQILNSKSIYKNNFLEKYGIELEKDSIVIENKNMLMLFIIISILLTLSLSIILLYIYLKYNSKKDKDIEEIENYIEKINKGNYKLKIDNNTEDELSILKNEVYKTMIMLKESSENSSKDKESLKDSLSDISHQLKTPITSIMIALDNLEDNPDLDIATREKFIKSARRDINNIRFLIQSILKLSKFDANAVEFIKKNVAIKDLIMESIKNVENLCDLRNVSIKTNNDIDAKIYCDKHWQIEAITNIIKNAVEHADNYVSVNIEENNVYVKIIIENDGEQISKEDLPNIFKRFYKGKNATKDSIGIGLALAKTIVESEKGYISVESKKNLTEFTIKYSKI